MIQRKKMKFLQFQINKRNKSKNQKIVFNKKMNNLKKINKCIIKILIIYRLKLMKIKNKLNLTSKLKNVMDITVFMILNNLN